MRPFEVYAVMNGWVVKIGCQMMAYTDKAKLVSDFDSYITDPRAMEQLMLEKYAGKKESTACDIGGARGAQFRECTAQECVPTPRNTVVGIGGGLFDQLRG